MVSNNKKNTIQFISPSVFRLLDGWLIEFFYLPTVLEKLWQQLKVNVDKNVENVLFLHSRDGRVEVLSGLDTLCDCLNVSGLEQAF